MTQKELARQMTVAGASLTKEKISRIERGSRQVTVDELVYFSVLLQEPVVRLLSPWEGEEEVWVTRHYDAVQFRNFLVYGDAWMPAARDAQTMMRWAYASRDVVLGSAAAKPAAASLLDEIKASRR